MVPGLPAWYPPGIPALFACAAFLTGVDPGLLYSTSFLWLSWILPVSIFLLARHVWDRATAWLTVPFVVFGSRWWLVHALVPMSSILSVSVGLLALLAWNRCRGRPIRGAALAAGLIGATMWCHVLCGAMVVGAIVTQEVLGGGAAGPHRGAIDPPWKRPGLWAVAIGVLLGSPPLLTQFLMPRLNAAPLHWFAPELHDPRFVIQSETPLVPVLGLVGMVHAVRHRAREGWLLGYVTLGMLALGLGYLGHDVGWPLPWAVPHQFQWHAQLGLSLAAAAAAVRLGRGFRRGAVAVMLLVAIVSIGPGLRRSRDASSYLISLDYRFGGVFEMSRWIQRNLPPRSVLVGAPDVVYVVAALSGSFTILPSLGHLNPAADVKARLRDVSALFTASDDDALSAIASRCGAQYLLVTGEIGPVTVIRTHYDTWPSLRRLHEVDTTAVLYQFLGREQRSR
jgi:hypothetical protein